MTHHGTHSAGVDVIAGGPPAQFGFGGFLEFMALLMPLLTLGALVLIGCWVLVKWILPRLLRGSPSPAVRILFAIPLLIAITFIIAAFLQSPTGYWGYFGYLVVLSGMIEGGVLVQRLLKLLSYVPDSVRTRVPLLRPKSKQDDTRGRGEGDRTGRGRNRVQLGAENQQREQPQLSGDTDGHDRNRAHIGGSGTREDDRNRARVAANGHGAGPPPRDHDGRSAGRGQDGWRHSLRQRLNRVGQRVSANSVVTRLDRWLEQKTGIGLKKVAKEVVGWILKFWYKRKVKRTGTILAILAALLVYHVVKPRVTSTFRLAEIVLTTFTAVGAVNILIWKLTKLTVADPPEKRMDTLPIVGALVIVISTFTVRLPDTYLPGAESAQRFLSQYVSYADRLVETFLTIPLVDFGVMVIHFIGLLLGAGIAVYVHRQETAARGVS